MRTDDEASSPGGPVELGMVGCGLISDSHGVAARKLGAQEVRFVVCADVREPAARGWSERYGCRRWFVDMAEMVRTQHLDGVVLATWPSDHFDHLRRLVDAGARCILMEKPLTIAGDEALDLWRSLPARGVTIVEGWMFRHHPIMRELKRIVVSGELGRVDTIHACFQVLDHEASPAEDTARNWRQRKEAGGGVAYDYTSYCAHVCTYLAQSLPRRVSMMGDKGRYGTVVRLHGHIEFENGVVALVQSSKRALMTRSVEVNCEQGSAYVSMAYGREIYGDVGVAVRTGHDPMAPVTKLVRIEDEKGQPVLLDTGIAQQRQLLNFADVVRGRDRPEVPLVESVVNVITVEAMVESALKGMPLDVPLPSDVAAAWRDRPLRVNGVTAMAK